MNIGTPEAVYLLVTYVIAPAVFLFFGYWVVRLAIRHEARRESRTRGSRDEF
ncbi:hypothetical protein ABZ897_38280 [Nonomuraea sp. NPDC046802]|uniref:hypothetical protein n=1 Tax=Nonomuraea sp. NPDC046802 TaxID=3154919 RepID=UPI0033D2FF3B